jgi:hypothetical protein
MVPVLSLMRISCSRTDSVVLSMASGLAGMVLGVLVRGMSVMAVGRWPPREKVVR